jgi:ATPase subunit of ABC transporter with duplicated ATPase domains
MHFHHKKIQYYPGDFDSFEEARADRLKKLENMQEQIDKQVHHMESSISKMQAAMSSKKKKMKDSTASKLGSVVRSRTQKLSRVGADRTLDGQKFKFQEHAIRPGSLCATGGNWANRKTPHKMKREKITEAPDPLVKFVLPSVDELGSYGSVLQLQDISLTYPGATSPTLSKVSMDISLKSRLAIIGNNGAGKSTLLKLIIGDLEPTKGEVHRHHNLKIGYLTQHHVSSLDRSKSALQVMMDAFPGQPEHALRAQLGRYGLHGPLALQPLGTLSGGQQARAAFALQTQQRPHILVLDEPTNHLDYETVQALTQAMAVFEGGIVLASHNQSVIKDTCKEMWLVRGGEVNRLQQSYDSFDAYVNELISKCRYSI